MALALSAVLAACSPASGPPPQEATVLAIGDSLLTWNSARDASVPDVVAQKTGLAVSNRAVSGARLSATSAAIAAKGGDIRLQYVAGAWDWVLLNGGGNDLIAECGCRRCDETMASLVGPDGQGGDIPALVGKIVADGATVVLIGYYHPPAFPRCADEVDALNGRLAALARRDPRVLYVGADTVIDSANPAHLFLDRVHPSRLGAALIGTRIAEVMKSRP